jgi:putative tricarboxylic transport membrane protein
VSPRKSIDRSELVASVTLIALGLFAIHEARAWEYMTHDGPGPGFFPLWIGIAMVTLSALYLASHAYDVMRGQPVHRTGWSGTALVIAGWAAFMVVVALIKPIGFIAALIVLVVIYVRVIYRRSYITTIATAAACALSFWFLFVKLLGLRLPAGPWGF